MATWIKRYDNSVPDGFSYVQLEDFKNIAVRGSDTTWLVQGVEKATGGFVVFGPPVSYTTQAAADAVLAAMFHAIGAIDVGDYS